MLGPSFALVGATVYAAADESPTRDGIVLVKDGKIAAAGTRNIAVPHGFEIVDCSNCTIVPGLWNSHVHFFERKWAAAAQIPAPELERQLQEVFARYGFTTVFDLSSQLENTKTIRARIESHEVTGPLIRSTGEGLVSPGALPSDTVTRMMGVMPTSLPEVADVARGVAAAKALLEKGADAIKIFIQAPASGGPAFSVEIVSAVAEEVHRAGKLVFTHPATGDDVLTALRGGVDVIAHTTPHSGEWSEAIMSAVRDRKPALTPTLDLWKYFARHDRLSTQERIIEVALGQLRAWIDAGGTVLFGTDLGAVDYDPSPEYELMESGGMTFQQILASLTSAPAKVFGDGGRLGRIAADYAADLVVLNGDPAAGIRALSNVQFTLRDGKISSEK